MHRHVHLLAGLLIVLLAGCKTGPSLPPAEGTLAPDLATGTAIVGAKFTQAAELTLRPMTPEPTEQLPIATISWTPSPNDGVAAGDSGKSFEIWITSRISIILDGSRYPLADLREDCEPTDVLGRVSNIPPVPAPFYVVRYEGVQLGKCTISDHQFEVTISVVQHP